MYKLLTTAAVIAIVATPSFSNEWTGHKDLVQKLEQTYGYLDGETQFEQLEGAYTAGGQGNGQLSNFFNVVDQGITHITLTVNADHTITPDINEGVAFVDITAAKDELVSRVNYDLFVDTDAANFNYQAAGDYTTAKEQGIVIDGSPENGTGDNEYTSNQNGGLAGEKITGLVDNVNEINNYLVDGGTTNTNNQEFIAAYNAGTGIVNGIDVDGNATTVDIKTGFFDQIDDLNGAIGLTTDGTTFFGNIDLGNVSETTINNFAIPNYVAFDDIGNAGAGGYNSISDWANSTQTVEVGAVTGTVASSGSITVTNTDAGSEAISVDVSGVITNYTFNAETNTFDAV